MPMYKVEFESWVYNFTHHLADFEIEAQDMAEAEAWAKERKTKFSERSNAVLKCITEMKEDENA